MGWEGELTFKYKSPAWMEVNFARLLWILTIYYWVYYVFFLGDQTQAFFDVSYSHPWNKPAINEYVPKYEQMYYFDRPYVR